MFGDNQLDAHPYFYAGPTQFWWYKLREILEFSTSQSSIWHNSFNTGIHHWVPKWNWQFWTCDLRLLIPLGFPKKTHGGQLGVYKLIASIRISLWRNHTWWLIPLSKWVITPVISGLTLLIPFITGVITHLLSGMSHQVLEFPATFSVFGRGAL